MNERSRWDATASRASEAQARGRWSRPLLVYGPWAESERKLGLLGDLRGARVLDLGCGEGENAVALALAGAQVTGLDISPRRLENGQALAAAHGVTVDWQAGDMHDALLWRPAAYDLVLATYVMPYSRDPKGLLGRCRSGLSRGGRLVMSMDHPLRDCFWDEEAGELVPYAVQDYHRALQMEWKIAGTAVQYWHRPLGAWLELMVRADFTLERLVEPKMPAAQRATEWPADSPLAPLAHVPHTLILIGRRGD